MATKSKPGFWSTLPGLLTALAAVATAATGAYVALHKPGPPPEPTKQTAPALEPRFLRIGSFRDAVLAEFTVAPPPPSIGDSSAFLRLTDASFGTVDTTRGSSPDVFRFELSLTNTTPDPILLDLSSRYFSLEDDQGHSAD